MIAEKDDGGPGEEEVYEARIASEEGGHTILIEPYEEFEDGHFSTSYRYETSLPMLIRALSTP